MPDLIYDTHGNAKRVETNRENRQQYQRNRSKVLKEETHCWLCGGEVDFNIKWPEPMSKTVDHVIAYANGGDHSRENLRLAHNLCNQKRGSKDADQVRKTPFSRQWY